MVRIGLWSVKISKKWSKPMIFCSCIVAEHTIPNYSRYVEQSFCLIVAKKSRIKRNNIYFFLWFSWNTAQPIPVKEESVVLKNGWFVLGSVRVTSFVSEKFIWLNSVSSSLFQWKLIISWIKSYKDSY